MDVIIRNIREEDAEAFLELCLTLDKETEFMLLEPGERRITPEEQRQKIAALLAADHSMIFVAEADGQLAGYLGAYGSSYQRNRHSVYLVLGIRQAFSGQGVGTRLFTELQRWAEARNLHRLELTVMAHNEAAIALYKKAGFETEGIKKDSIRLGDRFVDELYMAKLLPS
ncbi:GNAT family N-acetyltransferase [Fontibacillus sp. BL9]|uniref:GNAT family N-acetyltransferase n=1 Tax=Fontibacillus sp. BL9 TaxID=3389971 RepID=UPI00397B6060